MIRLKVNRNDVERALEQVLVPKKLWDGGWRIIVWHSRTKRWETPGYDGLPPRIDYGPFLRAEKAFAKTTIEEYRRHNPRRRFRLQRIGGRWLINFYGDIIWSRGREPKWWKEWTGGRPQSQL